jgi:hypothetical protein
MVIGLDAAVATAAAAILDDVRPFGPAPEG